MASIDERIVNMQFNNKQFESGIKSSIQSLKNLKEGLDFTGAYNSFEKLGKASKNLSFENLAGDVDTISNRFTTLGIIGVTAIQKITNAAIDAGTKMTKALSTDNIVAGFTKYEEKTKAMQTIISATGKSIEEVNEQVSKLNWYTDETSYNFSDMISNVGKFTAQGVELQDAVQAMEGISNWAAISGQGINQASRAMYNLSQALGLGYVRISDWMSIELANMATVEFKETVIETAKEMGTLTDEMNVTVDNFRSTLAKGWFNNDVLIAVLKKYGEYAEIVNTVSEEMGLTAAQAMEYITEHAEELGIELNSLGERAFKAAQEAKTFSEAVEAVKDAVSTGWMTTFELLFGNYEEAKELWTDLANGLYGIFAEGINQQNEMLEVWREMGGRTVLIEALTGAFRDLLLVLTPIKKALNSIFPVTAEGVYNLTVQFRDLMNELWISQQTFDSLTKIFKGFFSVVEFGMTLFGAFLKAISPLTEFLRRVGSVVVYVAGCIGELIAQTVSLIEESGIIEDLVIVIQNGLLVLGSVLLYAAVTVAQFLKAVSELPITQQIIAGIKSVAIEFYNAVYPLIQGLITIISSALNTVKNGLNQVNMESALNATSTALTFLYNVCSKAYKVLKTFFSILVNGFSNIKNIPGLLGSLVTSIQEVVSSIKNMSVDEDLKQKFEAIKQGFSNLISYIKTAFDKIKTYISALSVEQIFAFAAGIVFLTVALKSAQLLGAATDVLNSISEVVESFQNRTKDKFWNSTIIKVASGITMVAASMYIIAQIPSESLENCIGTVLGIAMILTAITVLDPILTKLKGTLKQSGLISKNLIVLAASILIMANALKTLDGMSASSAIGGLASLTVMAGELIGICVLMSKFVKSMTVGTTALISIALSIRIMASTLESLTSFNLDSTAIINLCSALTLIVLTLGTLSVAASKLSLGGGVGMLAIVTSIIVLQKALTMLMSETSIATLQSIQSHLVEMAIVMILLTALSEVMRNAGEHALGAGVGMMAMSAALYILAGVLEQLNSIEFKDTAWYESIGVKLGVITITAIALMEMSRYTSGMIKAGIGLTAMAFAFTIFADTLDKINNIKFKNTSWYNSVTNNMGVLTICAAALMAVSKYSNGMIKAGIGLTAMAAAFYILAKVVDALNSINFKEDTEWYNSAQVLLLTLSGLAAGLIAVTALTKKAKLGPLVAMIGVLGTLVSGLTILTLLDTNDLLKSALALTGALVGIGYSLKSLSSLNVQGWLDTIKSMLMVVTLVVSTAGAFTLLASIPWQSILSAGIAMAAVFTTLSKVMLSDTVSGIGSTSIVGTLQLCAMVVSAGLSLSLFAGYDWNSILSAGLSLSAVMVAAAAAAKLASGSIDGAAAIVVMAGAVVILSAAFKELDDINYEVLQQALIAMGLFTAAMVALGAIVGYFSPVALGLAIVAAALVVFGVAAIEFGVAANLFAGAFDTVINTLLNFQSVGPEAAANIGNCIETILSSFGTGVAEAITGFGGTMFQAGLDVISGFINGIGSGIGSVVSSAGSLASGVLTGICTILGINSPSVRAMELGLYTATGLYQGLNSGQSLVYSGSVALGAEVPSGILSNEAYASAAGLAMSTSTVSGITEGQPLVEASGESSALSFEGGFLSKISAVANTVLGSIKNIGSNAITIAKNTFGSAGQAASKAFQEGLLGNTSFEDIVSTISEEMEEAQEASQKSIEEMMKKIQESTPSIDDYSSSLSSVGSSAGSSAASVSDQTESIKTNAKYVKYSTATIQAYADAYTILGDKFSDADRINVATIAVNAFAESIYDAQRAEEGLSDVSESASERLQGIKETFISTYEAFRSSIESAMSLTSAFSYGTATSTSDLRYNMVSDINGISAAMTNMIKIVEKGLNADLVSELLDDLPNNMDTILGYAQATNEEVAVFNELYETWSTMPDDMAAYATAIKAWSKSGCSSLKQYRDQIVANGTATEDMITILDNLIEKYKYSEDTTYGVVTSIEAITAAYDDCKNSLEELLASQIEYFEEFETDDDVTYESMYEGMESQYKAFSKWGEMLISISERTGDDGQAFMEMLRDMGIDSYDYLQALNYSTDEEIQAIVDLFNKINDYIPQEAENITNAFSSVYNAFGITTEQYNAAVAAATQCGSDITQGATDGLTDSTKLQALSSAGETVATTAIEAIKSEAEINSPSKKTEEVGKYFVEGLTEGINNDDCRNRLVRAIKNMAEEMISALEDKLEVNSPSERTTAIGEFLDLGLIQGLSNLTGKVKTAAQSVAEGTMDAISSGLNSISDLMSDDLDNTLVITPVLDLTNVQSGLGSMNAMLTDPSYGIGMSGINLDSVSRNNSTQTAIPTKTDNSDVVNAVNSLKTEMAGIKTGLNNMKIVLDTGVMAGAVAQGVSAKIQNGVKKKEVVWA